MIKSICLGLFISIFCLTSCEKKVLEIVPVLQIEEDISIPEGGKIKYFSFPSATVGFAAADTAFIFKTTNGGKTWSRINVAGSSLKCGGVEFFDELNGMVLMGTGVYLTANGGQTWTLKKSGNFIGMATGNIGVIGRWDFAPPLTPGPRAYCTIFTSDNKGNTFQETGKVQIDSDLLWGSVSGSKVCAAGKDAYYERVIYGLDILSGQKFQIPIIFRYDAYPRDFFMNEEDDGIVVGDKGLINPLNGLSHLHGNAGNNYFSASGFHHFIIFAGHKSIVSNLDIQNENTWNEVLDKNGNSFKNTFYKVKCINEDQFYISGNNGLLWKAKI